MAVSIYKFTDHPLLCNLHSSFSCVGEGGGGDVRMFIFAANLLISGICDSSSWTASVMASPVSLAISSSSVERVLVPLMY